MDNTKIIEEFRANHGIVGGFFTGATLLLMKTKGAKSGKESIIPVVYTKDGDNFVVIASKGGAPENPGWYYNLVANPEITVEVGDDTFTVRAINKTGEEREKLFDQQAKLYPNFNDYKAKTTREIPVFILERI